MTTSEELPSLESVESHVLGDGPYLRKLQEQAPVLKVRTPAGDEAWLVTRYSEVKKLLRDRRLGRAHPDPENAPRYLHSAMFDVGTASDFESEPEVHDQFRAVLKPHFTASRLAALEPRINALVNDWVDRLMRKPQPVELQSEFSLPLSLQVLCELIGVEPEHHTQLEALLRQASGLADQDDAQGGKNTLEGFLSQQAARKRENPGEDVMSTACEMGLTDQQVAMAAIGLLFAGHGSVASHIGFGVARLATNDKLRETILSDPKAADKAIEEMLRTSSAGDLFMPHYIREDLEIADVLMRRGDLVLLGIALANLDDRAFDEPDKVDLTRSPNPHLTFSYGMWHCVGAPLARMELRIIYRTLLQRMPDLRLVAAVDELATPTDHLGGGLTELLVTW